MDLFCPEEIHGGRGSAETGLQASAGVGFENTDFTRRLFLCENTVLCVPQDLGEILFGGGDGGDSVLLDQEV